jgi:hypothetical protein
MDVKHRQVCRDNDRVTSVTTIEIHIVKNVVDVNSPLVRESLVRAKSDVPLSRKINVHHYEERHTPWRDALA